MTPLIDILSKRFICGVASVPAESSYVDVVINGVTDYTKCDVEVPMSTFVATSIAAAGYTTATTVSTYTRDKEVNSAFGYMINNTTLRLYCPSTQVSSTVTVPYKITVYG